MTLLIVGGGKMGMSHLALCTPYVGKDNIAVCDTQFLTRKFFQYLGYRAFASVDKAADKLDRIAGIVVATPTSSHAALGRWALERKIPVFIEKPLTLNVEASDRLARLAMDRDVPAQVGFVMRYVASFQRLRVLVHDGGLGRLQGYSASMRGNVMTAPPAQDNWQGNFARGGGCLNEYGPHVIDLCRFVFGSVVSVDKAQATRIHSVHADDRTEVEWTHATEGGDHVGGKLLIDWADESKRKSVIEFIVDFEAARLRVDNSTVEVEWRDDPVDGKDRPQVDFSVDPANVEFYLRGEEFSLELEDFLATIGYGEHRVRPSLSNDTVARLEDGCEVDKLIDLIARKAGLK